MSPARPPDTPLLVLTTFPDEAVARSLADRLLTEKLAACVSLLPNLRSIYRWKGNVESEEEWLGLIKTQSNVYPKLEAQLQQWHPYDTPEILALDVAQGSAAYLEWMAANVAP